MGALDDWRVAVVETALESLSDIARLAGSFLRRRFGQEAWPRLLRLLREGPSQQRIIAPGQDDLSSPVVVQRAQRAVLHCLRDMAQSTFTVPAFQHSSAADVLVPLSGSALVAVADLMGDKQAGPVREAATSAFVAISEIDADAAWALLMTALRSIRLAALPYHGEIAPPGFPSVAEISGLPKGCDVPRGLRTCGESKLKSLAEQVGAAPVRWHQEASNLLRV